MRKRLSLISALFVLALLLLSVPMLAFNSAAADTEIVFNLGANGTASHNDGSSKTSHSETVDGYTLSITGGTSMYTGARDQKGNSCIKLGTSSKTGGFSFTVPSDVTSVIIHVGKYKANTTKVSINGTTHTLTKTSNNGEYDAITVDTTSTKTIKLTTVSGGVRAMVNTITFVIAEVSDCEHDWVEGEVTTAPTCTTKGEMTYTCSKCDETKTEPVDALAHNYVDGWCTCGYPKPDSPLTIEEALALGVKYPDYTADKYYVTGVITEVYNDTYGNMYLTDENGNTFTIYGTYSADGKTRYDALEVKPIAGGTVTVYGIIGQYNGTSQMKDGWITEYKVNDDHVCEFSDPTCTEPGKCVCGETQGEALGHDWADATCTAPKTCNTCGETEGEKLDHTYVDGVCSVCDSVKPGGVVATFDFGENESAAHNDGGSKLSSSTKYTAGEYTLTITSPENVYPSARDAKGNSCLKLGTGSLTASFSFTVPNDVTEVVIYIAGYKANNASVVVNGTTYAISTHSNDGEYTAIKVDTSATKTVTFATNSTPDERCMINTIEFCAAAQVTKGEVSGTQIVAGESLSFNYYVDLKEDAEKYTMVFTVNGKDFTIENATENNGKYMFTLTEVGPHAMGATITSKLYYKNIVTAENTYSIKANLAAILADEAATSEAKALASALLYYGAAAQNYIGYDKDNLVTGDVENILPENEVEFADTDNVKKLTGDANDQASFKSAGVYFDYMNKIFVKINATSIEGVVLKVGETTLDLVEDGEGVYVAYTDGILPTDYDEEFTFELYVKGDLTQTLTYSVNSYAYAKRNSNGAIKALTNAMYNYGKAAEAYKAAADAEQ